MANVATQVVFAGDPSVQYTPRLYWNGTGTASNQTTNGAGHQRSLGWGLVVAVGLALLSEFLT